ncbi:MAG: hypothetical protein KatS3mg003_0742 [Candidatus Nitrosocaldaceae archaeon]|nr:MAG: hypothetical protein KatS3mg003_0742 [Candidatus Nitrosocaldaceae archaeon]
MKVAIKDLIELKERITYHSNEYNKIADSKILVARLDNKLYIIDGHARVKKAKDRKEEEIEAEVINANSYEEIVRKHIEINNFRGIIDHIALAIACKEHNLGYIDKTILDKLDIEALRELEKAIRKV